MTNLSHVLGEEQPVQELGVVVVPVESGNKGTIFNSYYYV